jgi:hypothetical protein
VVVFVAERRYTIPITCCLDGQAHDVTDENVAAGRHTGEYRALCGYVVLPAAMAAPDRSAMRQVHRSVGCGATDQGAALTGGPQRGSPPGSEVRSRKE